MNYFSTRDHQHIVSAAQAIACGLAPDGGLFVPETLPEVSAQQLQALCGMTYQQRAVEIMRPFLSEFSDEELSHFTAAAYGSQFDDAALRRCAGSMIPPRFSSSGTGRLAHSRTWRCRFCRTCSRRA